MPIASRRRRLSAPARWTSSSPKETHIFHLHAHRWFAGNDPHRGSYPDSQTVGRQQGFTYNIYHGGLRGPNGEGNGWWDMQGSGNRNRTAGDSIFHCHLYPHFAQGMWALWRVHDVLEDGTRKLPDGQEHAGLSLSFRPDGAHRRLGSVDRVTGAWLDPGARPGAGRGTPVPALIPLPGEPLPLLPTYSMPGAEPEALVGMPGYPFFIPAVPGQRPLPAPLDIARDLGPAPRRAKPTGGRRPAAGSTAGFRAISCASDRDLFQTTAQRWFADPMLSPDGRAACATARCARSSPMTISARPRSSSTASTRRC